MPALLEPELSRECECLAEPATSALRRASRRIDLAEDQRGVDSARVRERRLLEKLPRELLRTGPITAVLQYDDQTTEAELLVSGLSFARQ